MDEMSQSVHLNSKGNESLKTRGRRGLLASRKFRRWPAGQVSLFLVLLFCLGPLRPQVGGRWDWGLWVWTAATVLRVPLLALLQVRHSLCPSHLGLLVSGALSCLLLDAAYLLRCTAIWALRASAHLLAPGCHPACVRLLPASH